MAMRFLVLLLAVIVATLAVTATRPANAAPVTSKCLAVASNALPVVQARFRPAAALENNQVRLEFIGHSTFVIESPQGIRIATDYAGWHGTGPLPNVVTMNQAHETHYTDYPDPEIQHVLRGWNPDGGYAEHNLTVGDFYIRNVPTNIRGWMPGETIEFGNSIFIFEVSGLCIGHLGHLHHELTPQQLGQIGQLDVVLVPVDGTWTLDHDGMFNVLKELRARIVIPMHVFGSIDEFAARMQERFEIKVSDTPSVILSPATMPLKPQLLVLPGF